MAKNNSYDYWLQRQEDRILHVEKLAEKGMYSVLNEYDESLKRVKQQIDSIMNNYAKDVGMSRSELTKMLTGKEQRDMLDNLRKNFYDTGTLDKSANKWLKTNYLSRLDRETAIKQQLQTERRILAKREEMATGKLYGQAVNDTYRSISNDLTGYSKDIPDNIRESILNNKWVAGKNYSDRIWANTDALARDVNTMVKGAMLSGTSPQRLINDVTDRYNVARYQAATLIRTETNQFANSAELQCYKDDGITKYTYLAILDSRTSSICVDLDGKEFDVDKASPGENYPPMHPNCRSTTVPVIEGYKTTERLIRDKNTGENQTVDTSDVSYMNKIRHVDGVTELMKESVTGSGGRLEGLDYRVKTKESLDRKVAPLVNKGASYQEAIEKQYDLMRYTSVASPNKLVYNYNISMNNLKKRGFNHIETKNTFNIDNAVYKGINVKLEHAQYGKVELQFHTQESFDLKNGLLHNLYEKQRVSQSYDEIKSLNEKMIELSSKLTTPKNINKIKNYKEVTNNEK